MALTDSQDNAVISFGESPAQIVLAGTVTKGDALGFSSGWKRALATVGSVVQLRCVAGSDGVSGETIVAYFGDIVITGGRFTGGVAGSAFYVAEGSNNGKYTETKPTTSGDADGIAGYTVTATTILVTPQAKDHSTV